MAKVKRPTNVFISYARADAHRLDGIVQSLVARGLVKEDDRILREEISLESMEHSATR